MSKSKSLSLNFNAKIKSFTKLNDEFSLCKCYIQALGKNRNLSHFSKENVLKNIESLNYVPVVGHLIEGADGELHMGSHDSELCVDENGVYFKDLTVPFGVVPYQDKFEFEEVTESNGNTATYLVGDVILWTGRYPQLLEAVYDETTYFNQSMEINVNDWKPLEEDNNYMDIIDYNYSALCLLGKSDDKEYHVEPCFPSSRVEAYNFDLNRDEFEHLMDEMKDKFALCFEDTHIFDKGGTIKLEKNKVQELLEKYNLTLEQLDFEVESFENIQEFEEALKTFVNKKIFMTYREKEKAIRSAISAVNCENDYEKYVYLCDFDEKFAYVTIETYLNGQFDTKYGRYSYNFDSETNCVELDNYEDMVITWLTMEEDAKIKEERNNINDKLEQMQKELDELRQFKADKIQEEHKLEIDTALQEFVDLQDNEEFKELQEKCYEFKSTDDLKKECYAIRGKYSIVKPQPSNNANTTIKVKIPSEPPKKSFYGDLFNKYSK